MSEVHKGRTVRKKKTSATVDNQSYALVLSKKKKRGVPLMIKAGRNGEMRKARGYSLEPEKLEEKIQLWRSTGQFVSPYTKSILTDLLIALSHVALNKAVPFDVVRDEMQRIMEKRVRGGISDWQRFSKKKKRTKKGLELNGKIEAHVLGLRKNNMTTTAWPSGFKLAQMGCCVDWFKVSYDFVPPAERRLPQNMRIFLRLNTHSTTPLKEFADSENVIPEVDLTAPTLGPQ